MRLAYADPPYPKLAHYYKHEPTYAGEVDHKLLLAQLEADYPQGWALSTSSEALRDILPLCPRDARVCPWVKPIGPSPLTYGAHNTWEPLIVVRGRDLRPGFRDWLCAQPARHGGSLLGRKPLAFCAFLFQQLGALPGDTFVDLYPGTGIVGRAWTEFDRAGHIDVSIDAASSGYRGDVASSAARADDVSLGDERDGAFADGAGDAHPPRVHPTFDAQIAEMRATLAHGEQTLREVRKEFGLK